MSATGQSLRAVPGVETRHCEEPTGPAFGRPDDKLRDEAIQYALAALDCFAWFAMTIQLEAIAF
jgi:hypothetical protein